MALSGALTSRADPKPQSGNRDLNIHLYNLAGVPQPLLRHALARARDVLATAGIKPVWSGGPADAAEAHTVYLGKRNSRNTRDYVHRDFIVLLLAKDVPVGYAHGALGIAFPDSETGVTAMVFYERIEHLEHTQTIDGPTVLGLAIAHEIGHVLLRSSVHAKFGIMKSPWSRADLECAEARLAAFTHSECDAIRQQFTRTTRTESLRYGVVQLLQPSQHDGSRVTINNTTAMQLSEFDQGAY